MMLRFYVGLVAVSMCVPAVAQECCTSGGVVAYESYPVVDYSASYTVAPEVIVESPVVWASDAFVETPIWTESVVAPVIWDSQGFDCCSCACVSGVEVVVDPVVAYYSDGGIVGQPIVETVAYESEVVTYDAPVVESAATIAEETEIYESAKPAIEDNATEPTPQPVPESDNESDEELQPAPELNDSDDAVEVEEADEESQADETVEPESDGEELTSDSDE